MLILILVGFALGYLGAMALARPRVAYQGVWRAKGLPERLQ